MIDSYHIGLVGKTGRRLLRKSLRGCSLVDLYTFDTTDRARNNTTSFYIWHQKVVTVTQPTADTLKWRGLECNTEQPHRVSDETHAERHQPISQWIAIGLFSATMTPYMCTRVLC
jgi:hypothetical protein